MIPIAWIDGMPVAATATMVLEIRRSVFNEWGDWSYEGLDEMSLGRCDWSPAGDEVAVHSSRWRQFHQPDVRRQKQLAALAVRNCSEQ